MKKVFIASLVAAALAPGLASAETLNFTGNVVANTCTATAGNSQSVVMTNVQTASLANSGDHALGASFNVQLRNCGATAKNVRLEFSNATGVDTATGRMTNTASGTTAATNVQVALRASADATSDLVLGSASAVTPFVMSTYTAADANGNPATNVASIPLWAFYVANGGAATAGTVTSSVVFNIGYQ